MAKYNDLILAAAGEYLGLEEWPGIKHNPAIIAMYKESNNAWVKDDETPWCAAFMGSILAQVGLPNTGKLNARSYADYGRAVTIQQVMPGDIVVLWRNSPSAAEGHVAIFVRWEGDKVILRGGNQGKNGKVSDAPFAVDRIVAVRRAGGQADAQTQPTLRKGDRGAFVLDLQSQLKTLGYFPGKLDGDFGTITDKAVLDYQAVNGLEVDGVVGPATWRSLKEGLPRPRRDVTKEDLKYTRTMVAAKKAKATVVTAGTAAGTLVLANGGDPTVLLSKTGSYLGMVQGLIMNYWWLLAIGVAGLFLWSYLTAIEEARLDAAQSGKDLGV